MQTYVFYDVMDDRTRKRIYDVCRDFGLSWLQYSGFRGNLSRIRRGELCAALRKRLDSAPGTIVVLPVCERDELNLVEITAGKLRSASAEKLRRERNIMQRIRDLCDG
jgi:CRISPR-associated protein Cas2